MTLLHTQKVTNIVGPKKKNKQYTASSQKQPTQTSTCQSHIVSDMSMISDHTINKYHSWFSHTEGEREKGGR